MAILGKKAKKIKNKAKRKLREKLDSPTRAMAPPAGTDPPQITAEMREPTYPEDALRVQRTPKAVRKGRSAIKKKTIKEMHLLVNRRIGAVGAEQTVLNPDMTNHEKFVQLTRQTGNIGDTLAGDNPAPELLHTELIRVMALAAGWAQSLAPKRGQ